MFPNNSWGGVVCVCLTECVRYCRCVGGGRQELDGERERESESFPEQTTSTA